MEVDVRSMLSQAFGKTQSAEEPITEPAATVPTEADDTQEEQETAPEVDETTTEASAETPQPGEEVPAFDLKSYLKQEFGYDDPEQLKTELQELKTPRQVQFANDESKRIYENLLAGKEEEVADYLYTRKLLKNTDSLGVEDKLKLKLKLQYPDLDDDDVQVQFEKEFGFDEDSIDEALLKSEKKIHQARLKQAAAQADDFFKTYKEKIELPNITPAANAPEPSTPSAEDIEKAEQWMANLVNNLSSLKAEQATIKTSYVDEANKLSFDVAFVPDQQGFAKAKENAKDVSAWLDKNFIDSNGNIRTDSLTKLMYLYENQEKVMQGMLTQAKNSILRQVIASKKGIDPAQNVQRNYTTEPNTDIERARKQIFG